MLKDTRIAFIGAGAMGGAMIEGLQSPKHLARLRDQVTSPGGTSAEALYYLEKASFRTALSRAVWAAYQRSIELGRGGKRNRLSNSKKSG